jgi:hypothetical protein
MPAIWKKAVEKIKRESPDVNPFAVATASLQRAGDLKQGTRMATKQGVERGQHSSAWREEHPVGGRAARADGGEVAKAYSERGLDAHAKRAKADVRAKLRDY